MSSRAAWAALPQKAEECKCLHRNILPVCSRSQAVTRQRAPEDRPWGQTQEIHRSSYPPDFLVTSEETAGRVALTHIQWLLLLKWLHVGKKACGVFVETESDFVAKANLKLVIFLMLPPLFWGGTSASPCPSLHRWYCKYNCYRS